MSLFNLSWSCLHDPLSLFFVVLILLVTIPAAIYSIGYCRGMARGRRVTGGIVFLLFIASLIAVVTAGNALFFLVAWEVMSLLSYYLIVADTEDISAVRAGSLYIIMTHLATACLTAAFLLVYQYTGSFEFAAMRDACRLMPASTGSLVFVLFLAGFGTKAGMVPLHIWLPAAHPAAPSHVSAAMSGIMIKMGIYGLVRFVPGMMGTGPAWWGNALLFFGALSCLTGIMFALTDRNIKRILAFSSIENIGIILLAVGASLACASRGMPGAAAFALAAGLFHTANHAVFKSLLFLGAGSVVARTGTKNIEQYGGLIRRMPRTALAFLIGAMAIAAIPPLNGFAGEWLILQSFFRAASEGVFALKCSMPLAAAVLALTGGLAAACFVRVFGITFLGMARTPHALTAEESPVSMTLPMFFLAFMAVAMGLGASYCFHGCALAAASILGAESSIHAPTWWYLTGTGSAMTSPLVIAAALIFFTGIAFVVSRGRNFRRDRAWGCGYYALGSGNEYTGTAFSKPFRLVFSFMLRPYRKTETIREATYHVKSFKYEVHTTSVFKSGYDRAIRTIFAGARQMRRLQPGSIHLYLGYIFITILLLIIFMNRF